MILNMIINYEISLEQAPCSHLINYGFISKLWIWRLIKQRISSCLTR